MGCLRAILCIICPPLSVLDKGCGSVLIVTVLTLVAWVPGVIAAIIINNKQS
ncbi:MAG: YqaE/Pmp3 family membrane protein [Treponemataceae bacterium]